MDRYEYYEVVEAAPHVVLQQNNAYCMHTSTATAKCVLHCFMYTYM